MARFYLAVAALATAFALPLSPARAQSPDAGTSLVRVAFLGDSLTAGYGLSRELAFPSVIARRLAAEGRAVSVINAGVSGDTSAGGLRRLPWVLKSEPDVLVVALGANDGLRGLPVSQLEQNLRAIVQGAQAEGVRVLLAGMHSPPSMGPDYSRAFGAVYPRLAKELDVPLVPFLLDGVGGVTVLNQADGIHPTATGQEKIAETVLPHLRPLLSRTRRTS